MIGHRTLLRENEDLPLTSMGSSSLHEKAAMLLCALAYHA